MKVVFAFVAFAGLPLAAQAVEPALQQRLLHVKRVYVEELKGGPAADSLRELIIAGLNSTKLFILTDNQERADAVLKGAADDRTFVENHDKSDSVNSRGGLSTYSGGGYYGRSGGSLNQSGSESESYHIKEQKHEAYAAVRLCDRDGDVLWSTSQESEGGKFRGASADVAAKIARQLTLDIDRARAAVSVVVPPNKP